MKYQRPALPIRFLRLQEMNRLVAPVSARIQVVRGVIAVVEAVAIALPSMSVYGDDGNGREEGGLTGTSMSVMLDLKSESGSTSSTKAC